MTRPWFGQRRVGWGLRPVSWQGWLLTLVYLLVAFAAARALAAHHVVLLRDRPGCDHRWVRRRGSRHQPRPLARTLQGLR